MVVASGELRVAREGNHTNSPLATRHSPLLVTQRQFYFCSGPYYVRLVDELRPLTYGLVGKMTKLLPKDVWATILGHSSDVADALIQSMILS